MYELIDWRDRMDAMDGKIVEFVNERAKCDIGSCRIKSERGMKVHNPQREQAVIYYVKSENRGPLDHGSIQRIFEKIIEECRRIEIITH